MLFALLGKRVTMARLMQNSRPRVMVFGTFDLLHPGHLFVIQEAESRGCVTIVVARDSSVRMIKNIEPAQSEDVRKEMLERTFPGAHVLLGDPTDFLVPVRSVKPDLILLGYDQKLPKGIVEADLPCPTERLPSLQPEIYKSSVKRKQL